ncbi:MAG: 2-oxoacid:ferredoxin oxidoreductase, gamma subunit [Symbiobacteriaceae bacterium]|jgi:2-oxoglutarate ferredoxin oxidoreductase subunit gamma|nr:2-oxoacid:ferredoxin oxidoreductase, gamma subunit [Symbiobacteriaceae bacterium]
MMERMRLAGFGGQGIMFLGKVLAHAGMLGNKHVTWIPSYGPEMRGGTANCSVIISDVEIGEPVASRPDILVAMNEVSLRKFQPVVRPGGIIFVNSSLISGVPMRDDVTVVTVPVNDLARSAGVPGAINMVMLGAMLPYLKGVDRHLIEEAVRENVPASRQHMLDGNLAAVAVGVDAAHVPA